MEMYTQIYDEDVDNPILLQMYDRDVYANIRYRYIHKYTIHMCTQISNFRYIRKTQMCRQIYDVDVDNPIVLRTYNRDVYANLRY